MPRLGPAFFLQAVYYLVKPIARICLARSIKFQDFIDASKKAFLDTAEDELRRSGHTANDSKLSVITGLQRKDISKLRKSSPQNLQPDNLISRVIGLWLSEPYQDSKGKPKKLLVETKASEFAQLVHSVSQDLNHHTVLFELERLKIVKRDGKHAELTLPALIVRGDSKRALPMLSSDVTDLINTVYDNMLLDSGVPNLHAKTEYDNIPTSSLPKIREWLVDLGQRIHKEAREFLSKYDRDTNPSLKRAGGRFRVALGTFSITHEFEPEKSTEKEEKL